ncbi:hypothetical protein [Imhoffiella purpurea]|uniref:Alginate export domain-containing protein n=1 Tax=Imhoffiella purpurea TaxID=1249627 RepID=W9V7R8_9GAMM|nr:hypothetical protein [Imhoffiella purpurea]EXJ15628.1 hypothetical protein D779_1135 [Imhoffiella purpurea]
MLRSPRSAVRSCRLRALCCGLIAVVSVASAETGSWRSDGHVESRYQGLTRQGMETLSLRQRLWVNLNRQQASWELFAKAGVDLDPERHDFDATVEPRLHELYLNLRPVSDLRLSVGRKRILWGVADGRNTMDLINPSDNRDPLATGRSSTRLASDLVALEWLGVQQSLELVWLPWAAVDQQAVFGSPWEPDAVHALREADRLGALRLEEADDPDDSELALRYSHYGQGLDWYLVYFDGYRDDPLVERLGEGMLRTGYRRYHAYGAQVALGVGDSTLRLELAHKPDYPITGGDGRMTRTALTQLVVGWDYQLDATAYLNLQLYVDRFHDVEADDEYGEGQYAGLTLGLSDRYLDDQLTLGVRGMADVVSGESMTEIYAEYSPVDDWSFQLGHYFIDGPADSGLGQFADNWLLYAQLTHFFR